MPVGRTYSDKYQMQDKDEEDEMYLSQQASRERVRKLSAETNRRRKALELKKKLEAQKEAKRRHEVLEERRKRQQEATQRYQRLSRASPKKSHSRQDAVYTGPKLQDGIPMARGYRVNKVSDQPTPAMEDVLRMVGHQGEPSPQYASQPSNSDQGEQQHNYYRYEENGQQNQGMHFADKNANIVHRGADQAYHQKYHGYAAPATLTHEQNIDNTAESSVSYQPSSHPKDIQQELAEQQREFIEQQKKSLMEFNRALLQESVSKDVDVDCSSSVCSVDSLEEQDQQPSKKVNFAGNQRSEEQIVKDSVSGGPPTALQHGNLREYSNQNVSRFQDGNKYEDNNRPLSFQNLEETSSNGFSEYSSYLANNHSGQVMSGEHNVVSTINSDSSSQPTYVPAAAPNAHQSQNECHGYSLTPDENVREDSMENRSIYAWNNSSRYSKPTPSKTQSSPNTAPKNTTKFHNDNTKSRGFSTKTSATPVYMLAPSSRKQSVEKKRELSSNENHQNTSNVSKYVENSTLEDDTLHPGDMVDHQEHRIQVFDEMTPKSILKKTSKYSGNSSKEDSPSRKWGKNELRDSMDIASTTHVKRVPSKKFVRWTDLSYAGSESQTTEKSGNIVEAKPTPVDKQKPTVNARTVQQKLTASSGMEQPSNKGPVLLARSPFRAKFGSPSNRPGADGQSVIEQKSYSGRNYSTPIGKPPTGKPSESAKVTPKRVNGMTLNKTPTDEEINQLWSKVRTCLHSREASPEPKAADRAPSGMRRAASDQSLAESSQRLTANFRVMQPNRALGVEQVKMKKFHTVPRWRTSSDSGTNLSRRSSLLQQRQQGKRLANTDSRKRGTFNAPAPITSHEVPNRSMGINQHTYNDQVEDSLLTFQQAELLAQQNFSEAEIEAALDQEGPNNHFHESKMLSALSLEEQRILESLDRLNEKLRITSDIATNYPAMTPKPPAYGSGFRGHRPMSSKLYGTNSPGRPGLRVRSSSADRENSRIWNYR